MMDVEDDIEPDLYKNEEDHVLLSVLAAEVDMITRAMVASSPADNGVPCILIASGVCVLFIDGSVTGEYLAFGCKSVIYCAGDEFSRCECVTMQCTPSVLRAITMKHCARGDTMFIDVDTVKSTVSFSADRAVMDTVGYSRQSAGQNATALALFVPHTCTACISAVELFSKTNIRDVDVARLRIAPDGTVVINDTDVSLDNVRLKIHADGPIEADFRFRDYPTTIKRVLRSMCEQKMELHVENVAAVTVIPKFVALEFRVGRTVVSGDADIEYDVHVTIVCRRAQY